MSLFCALPSDPHYKHYQDLVKKIGLAAAQAYVQDNAGVLPYSDEQVAAIVNTHEVLEEGRTALKNKDSVTDLKSQINTVISNIKKVDEVYKDLTNEERIIVRVSDLIEEYKRIHGREWVGESDDFYALKGTIIHKYLEEINKAIFNNSIPSYVDLNKKIREELMLHDKFKGKHSDFFFLSTPQFNTLVRGAQELQKSLVTINNKIKKEYKLDKDIEIFTEVTILDNIADVAGTIDLLVMFADGSVAAYDYKSLINIKKSTQSVNKQMDWTMQMSNYVNILRNNYGITHVRQARIIPIALDYNATKLEDGTYKRVEEGFKAVGMYNSSNKSDLLKPLAIAEETTGDKNIDLLVSKLEQHRRNLIAKHQVTKGKTKQIELNSAIRSVTKAINDILTENDLNKLLESITNIKDRYMNRLGIPSHKDNFIGDVELTEGYQEVSVYENLSVYLKEQLDIIKKTKSKEEFAKIQNLINNLSNQLSELKYDMFQEILIRSGGENLLKEGQGISNIGKIIHGLDNWHIPIFQKLREIYSTAQEGARVDTERKYKRIVKINEALQKWGKTKGITGEKLYKLFYNNKTGNLHTKYNEDFNTKFTELTYRARNYKNNSKVKELTLQEKQWLDTHFKIDADAVTNSRNELIKDLKEQLSRKEITQEVYDERLGLFDKYSNPLKNKELFYNGNNEYNERVFIVPNEKADTYLSKEYQYIQSNEALKNYYEMFNDIIAEYREEYGWKVIGNDFVPVVHQDMTDLLARKGLLGVPEILETTKQKFKIREQDEVVGTVVNGKRVKTIPLLYVEKLRTSLSKQEIEALEAEIVFNKDSQQYKNELARKKRAKEYEKGLTNKSVDLTKSLMLFVASANEHRFLSKIEPTVEGLKIIINSNEMLLNNKDATARPYFDKFMGKVHKYAGIDGDLSKAFNQFVDRLVYKQQFENDFWVADKFSSNKILKSLMNFFSTSAIGANIILVMSNYLTARNNLWMMGHENVHFDKKDWDLSMKWFGKQDERFEKVYDYVQPTTRDYLREEAEAQGINFRSKLFRSQNLFIGHILGDDRIDAALAVAMSLKYRVDSDGKIKNPDLPGQTLINPNAKTVADSIIRDADGMTYIPEVNFKEFSLYRDKVRKMGQRIKGMTNEKQKGLIYSSMTGVMFMHLRSWMSGMATTRFGRLEFDETLGSLEQGRFAVAYGEIIHKGFLPTLNQFLKFSGQIIGMSKDVNMEVVQAKYKKFMMQTEGQYRDILTLEDFVGMQKAKMQSLAAELRVYLAFFALLQLLGGLKWDDEEEGNILSWNAQQVVRRSLLELSFWLSPSSAGDIIKSPIPLYGLLTRLGKIFENGIVQTSYLIRDERDPRNDKYYGYYTLRTVPGINQILNFLRVFEPYSPERSTFEKVFFDEL
jgi:hypothetical protein